MEGKEINILILGETGVGKSTFINAFVNYLSFDTLDQALNAPQLCSLIHSKFSVCDKNGNSITVSTGSEDNEVHDVGQSTTQQPRTYKFNTNGVTIRLIDTPGIGDVRGIEQDKENFKNILSAISLQENLHGILILLKPDDSKLSVVFRYCVTDLLKHLHKDAQRNIAFCFTNTSSTFYRPGDTFPVLRKLLQENNVDIPLNAKTIYCWDSEGFRFVAAAKNNPPVYFSQRERDSFKESWMVSVEQVGRLLRHIGGLTPHNVQSTLSLNQARELTGLVARPIAEISRIMRGNQERIENRLKEVKATNAKGEDLEKKSVVNLHQLKQTPLDHPMTVCAHPDCVQFVGSGDHRIPHYVAECHKECYLKGVTKDEIGHALLYYCAAMTEGTCNCGHNFKDHVHIWYKSEEIIVPTESEDMKRLLDESVNDQAKKNNIIASLQAEINSCDQELKEIEKATASFAHFLNEHAITVKHDAALDYMDHLIRLEEKSVDCGASSKVLQSLIQSKASYKQEIRLLEAAKARGDQSGLLKPNEVDDLIRRLYNLKHSGPMLKEAMELLKDARSKASARHETNVELPAVARNWIGFN